ncbi:phage tail tape measure protein [Mangrovicoccus ximenensis]|uniref:hypothetical protein n=1 Tax=Mangrovicoccus ximenensis TaxID=1911570 RepID=UPI000D3B7876|nr:hypothetical protein [Mangrovicoccus ximenensis]
MTSNTEMPGLIVPIEARINQLERSFQRANQAQRRFARDTERRARQNAERIGQQYEGLGANITHSLSRIQLPGVGSIGGLAGAGALAGIGLAAAQVHRTMRAVADIGNEAARAGVDAESFQRWQYVAERNRISLDAMTDSFRELNIRAEEWVATGEGSGAEAFARLGFSAEELAEKLKDPSELMLEIMTRLRRLDRAAQIRVADEVFGGEGGERFVEMLRLSDAEIRNMLGSASTLSAEQIANADELDRRYSALTTSIANGWKRAAVEVVDFARQVANVRLETDEVDTSSLFRSPAQASALLGDGVIEALDGNSEAVKAHAEEIAGLLALYGRFGAQADAVTPMMQRFAGELRRAGEGEAAAAINEAAAGMQVLSAQLDNGEISAGEFETGMAELILKAREAFESVADIDGASFGRVIDRLGELWDALDSLRTKATETREALPGGGGAGSIDMQAMRNRQEAEAESMRNWRAMQEANDRFTASEQARNAATTEALRLDRSAADRCRGRR